MFDRTFMAVELQHELNDEPVSEDCNAERGADYTFTSSSSNIHELH